MNYVEEETKKREIINKLQIFCDRYLKSFSEICQMEHIDFMDDLRALSEYSAFEFRDSANQIIFSISPKGMLKIEDAYLEKDEIFAIYQLSKMISDFFKELKVDD